MRWMVERTLLVCTAALTILPLSAVVQACRPGEPSVKSAATFEVGNLGGSENRHRNEVDSIDTRSAADVTLEQLVREDPELAPTLDEAIRRRIQISVAVPNVGPDGKETLRRARFRVDAEYFYPASAIKLCVALGATEKLAELRDAATGQPNGADELRDRNGAATSSKRNKPNLRTTLRFIEGEGRSRRVTDTTTRAELEKALVLSDNEASNRLFDFVGREELAERLSRIGLRSARIVQRLGDEGASSPPIIELVINSKSLPVAQRIGFEPPPPWTGVTELAVGAGYFDEQHAMVRQPMDFRSKNAIRLSDLQNALIAIVRPDLFDAGPPPNIDQQDRQEVKEVLQTLPSDTKAARRTSQHRRAQLDAIHKPIDVALRRMLPSHKLRIYGKGGRAFGFAVENIYVVDESTGRSFFLAATIYANDNEILNDDRYEYDSLANPFLVRLGETLGRTLDTEAHAGSKLYGRESDDRGLP